MILKEVLDKTTQFFRERKYESPRLEAELIFQKALNLSNRVQIYLQHEKILNESELASARDMVRRRSHGEPIAYIFGEKAFYHYNFVVNPAVLIPRPETELLVEEAVNWARINLDTTKEIKVLDIGSGSGCLGLSIVKDLAKLGFANTKLTCVDISSEALDVARKNAERLEVTDVEFINGDILEQSLQTSFDIIVSNPPYIASEDPQVDDSVKKFEPSIALFSGPLGTEKPISWAEKSSNWLKSMSFMGYEIGKDQGSTVKDTFVNLGIFRETKIVKDLSKFDRFVIGIKGDSHG